MSASAACSLSCLLMVDVAVRCRPFTVLIITTRYSYQSDHAILTSRQLLSLLGSSVIARMLEKCRTNVLFSFSPRSYRLQPTWYDIYLVPRYTDVCHSYGVCVPLLRPSRSTFSISLYFSSRDETSQVNRLVTITKLHTWKCSYVVEDHVFSSQRQETTYILRV